VTKTTIFANSRWRTAAILKIALSHTRTVVRECCKVDDASQWENWKSDPLPRPNTLTDRHKKLHTWLCHGYLPNFKIYSRSLKGFLFPVCAKLRIKMFTRLLFLGSSNDLQPRRRNRFSRVIRQTTRFRARMCLFKDRRQKFNIYTRNSRKTAILRPDIDATKFSTENRFTMGVLPCELS